MARSEEKSISGILKFFIVLFLIIELIVSGFAIYEIFLLSSIESLIRYIIIGIIVLLDFRYILKSRKIIRNKGKKKSKPGIHIFSLIIFSIICGCVGGGIFYLYGKVDNLNKVDITYTSNLIVLSNNSATKISDINDMTIGILGDTNSPDGYIIPQEIIKEHKLNDTNEVKEYEDYTSMIVDLYSKDLDAMFVTDGYVSLFSGIAGYENIANDTKVIISKDKKMKKAKTSKIETASTGKDITEPFTMLVMGIDSTDEILAKNAIANGDTLILVTFNPKTLNATMLSIPRDSYVPIACWSGKPENKITHAAAYGNDCMINTIQNYFDTKIDYYVKINFKGLVKLVNAVGGVEVDVPRDLCTDDSGRMQITCIKAGRQVLDGEGALVYARNRKDMPNGDFDRARHQQILISALINKIKTVRDVNTFINILNTVSNSMDTNLTTKQILSFYNVGKDILAKGVSSDEAEIVDIQRLFLQGTGQMIYDERAKMVLWDYIPNKSSRNDVVKAMNVNLELAKHEDITEFHFSINEPYEKKVIGEGPYRATTTYTLLPDFTGDTEAQARATASSLGIRVTFNGDSGTVVEQNYPAKKRVDLIKDTVVLKLSGGKKTVVKEKDDDDDDDDKKKDDDEKEDDNKEDDSPTPSPSPSTDTSTDDDDKKDEE